MPINDDDLLSAISGGIDSAGSTPPPAETPLSESPADEEVVETGDEAAGEGADDGAPVDEAAAGEGVGDETPAGEQTEEEKAAAEAKAKADKDAAGEQTEEEKAAAEAKAKAEADKAAGKKPDDKKPDDKSKAPDPINDPIPNALKKETRERIQTLVATVKTTVGERDKAVAERAELLGMIEETRATPQQYGDTLNYLKLVNSGDPVQLEQALVIMQREVEALAKMLGKPIPGVDMLSGHADLVEEVNNGVISQQRAEELAAARERQRIQNAQSQHRQTAAQTTERTNAELAEGRAALNAVGARLSKDPLYEAKNKVLLEALKPAIARAHPSEWAAIYENAYNALNMPALPKPRTVVPVNQPIRPKNPAGGTQKAPSSLLDAINLGIASAK